MDGKSEEEASSSTYPDAEEGTKKSGKKERVVMRNVEARATLPY